MANQLSFERELKLACTAVQLCANLTKQLQKEFLNSNSAAQKRDLSPVTIVDFAVQALLTSALSKAFDSDYFLAEENADELRQNEALRAHVWQLIESARPTFHSASLRTPRSIEEMLYLIDLGGKNERSDASRTWVLDPIDGTSTFLKGQQYAINCAFLVHGLEHLGIIGCPNLPTDLETVHEDLKDDHGGLMIFAIRGEGSWSRAMQTDAELSDPKRVKRAVKSLNTLVWSDCSSRTSIVATLHQRVAEKLGTSWPGVDLYSSLMNYAVLGLGYADIVIRIFKNSSWRSNIWDHAGGVLIYEEAGGKVTDLQGREIDFRTGRKMSDNIGLVCAPKNLHGKVLEVIREQIQDYEQVS